MLSSTGLPEGVHTYNIGASTSNGLAAQMKLASVAWLMDTGGDEISVPFYVNSGSSAVTLESAGKYGSFACGCGLHVRGAKGVHFGYEYGVEADVRLSRYQQNIELWFATGYGTSSSDNRIDIILRQRLPLTCRDIQQNLGGTTQNEMIWNVSASGYLLDRQGVRDAPEAYGGWFSAETVPSRHMLVLTTRARPADLATTSAKTKIQIQGQMQLRRFAKSDTMLRENRL